MRNRLNLVLLAGSLFLLPGCRNNTELHVNEVMLNDTMRRVYANTVLEDGLYENIGRHSPRYHFLKVSVDNITLYGWVTQKSKKDTVYYRTKAKYDRVNRRVTFSDYTFSRKRYLRDKLDAFEPQDNVDVRGLGYMYFNDIQQTQKTIKLRATRMISINNFDRLVFVKMK